MKKSKAEQKRDQKNTENFLYNLGYEYTKQINEEADRLSEQYADIEVPESLDRWFKEFIAGKEHEYKAQQRRKTLIRASKRLAAACLILAVFGLTLTMSVEAFRIRFFNMIVEVSESFTAVIYQKTENDIPEQLNPLGVYYPEYLPPGYELVKVDDESIMITVLFENEASEQVILSQARLPVNTHIDTEDAHVWEIEIKGFPGILSVKPEKTIILWRNDLWEFILSGPVDKSEILRMAESLVQKK